MLLQQRAAAAAGAGVAARPLAAPPAARAVGGRARGSVRVEAATMSSFSGTSLRRGAGASRSGGQRASIRSRGGAVVVKAMFERFTEKAIKVVM